jgi:hypothetical protein
MQIHYIAETQITIAGALESSRGGLFNNEYCCQLALLQILI